MQPGDVSRPGAIADRIVDAILAGRLAPGQRLGEQALADLFGCSRTLVREAMARLSARGMVEVNARRGWFVVQPSLDARRARPSAPASHWRPVCCTAWTARCPKPPSAS